MLPYQDPTLPITRRVEDLLARMTPAEKVAQLSARYWGKTGSGLFSELPDALFAEQIPLGIGHICQLGKRRPRSEAAVLANRVQRFCREKTRLGIPAIVHEETLHGMIANDVTCLPEPLTLAATWDPALVQRGFAVVGDEAARAGVDQGLSPVLDLGRDPRWGRTGETFGEDPALVASLGVAAVRGLQEDPAGRLRLAATGKHFAGYSQGEGGHNVGPFAGSLFEFCSAHLVPWRAAIRDGGLRSVMPSYAAVDGLPCHANAWLLRHVLRDRLGFTGPVVADYGGVAELADLHAVADGPREAAGRAIRAGMDLELPNGECYDRNLADLMARDPAVAEAVDGSVVRVLTLKFELGLFEDPYVDEAAASAVAAEADAVALQLAEQGAVLLANPGGILPLDPARLRKVAVVGPHAGDNVLGPYFGSPRASVNYIDGLRQVLPPEVELVHAPGCRITGPPIAAIGELNQRDPDKDHTTARLSTAADDQAAIAAATALVRGCEVCVLVLGDDLVTTHESFRASPKGDRADLGLWGGQRALLAAIRATGVPLVVVLAHVGPIAEPDLMDGSVAILDVGCPGQAAGLATARVLLGLAEPGGRLPITIPRSAGHLPCFGSHAAAARRGYGFENHRALYPFGFGLGYTTIAVRSARLRQSAIPLGQEVGIEVVLANQGTRPGSEVVQVYHRDLVAARTRPVRELAAFLKVVLAPGEQRTVHLSVPVDRLGYLDQDAAFVQEPGAHRFWVTTGADPLGGIGLDLATTATG